MRAFDFYNKFPIVNTFYASSFCTKKVGDLDSIFAHLGSFFILWTIETEWGKEARTNVTEFLDECLL